MVKRRHLTWEEALSAAEALQVALLDGISRARRWGRAELVFQGGTSLHLAYGSPRASEDLDFIVTSDKGLNAVMNSALTHTKAYVRQAMGSEAELEIKARAVDPETGENKNPRIYRVSFRAPAFLESVKVKVEFWVADPNAAASYDSEVRIARLSQEAQMRRPIRLAISQAIIPTAQLSEIYADKIHAIAGREYLKHRDVFDLWWLDQQGATLQGDALRTALRNRRDLYPRGPQIERDWANRLRVRATEIVEPTTLAIFSKDLSRWLALGGQSNLSAPEHTRRIAERAAARVLDAADLVDPAGKMTPDSATLGGEPP